MGLCRSIVILGSAAFLAAFSGCNSHDSVSNENDARIAAENPVVVVDGRGNAGDELPKTEPVKPNPAAPAAECGNGRVESGEFCDDGNLADDDGCDRFCQEEKIAGNPVPVPLPPPPPPTATCGNGIVEAPEACDDGNEVDADGCESDCSLPACGNGIQDAGELCLATLGTPAQIGTEPGAVALADFNLDGKLDLAVTDLQERVVRMRMGDGAGHFTPNRNLDVGQSPVAVLAADLNGDSRPDVAVANRASHTVSVYLNISDSSVTLRTVPVGLKPQALAALDLDGNGKADLVAANASSNDVTVAWDVGQLGTQLETSTFPLGNDGKIPVGVALGDLTGDGKPDIITANHGTDRLTVLQNQGSRTFANTVTFLLEAGAEPSAVALADFDGDGDLDVLGLQNGNAKLVSFRNDGDRHFVSQGTFATAAEPIALVTADFNRDGKLDVAAAHFAAAQVSLLAGNGNGTFSPAIPVATLSQAGSLAAGDLNGDQGIDLVVSDASQLSAAIDVLLYHP